jgi:hypothetical protein
MTEGFSKNELDTNRAFVEARIHGLLDEDAAHSGKANVPNPDSTVSPILRTQQDFAEVEEGLAARASSLRKEKPSRSKAGQTPKLPDPPPPLLPPLPRTPAFDIFPHPESIFDDFLYGTTVAIPAEMRLLIAKFSQDETMDSETIRTLERMLYTTVEVIEVLLEAMHTQNEVIRRLCRQRDASLAAEGGEYTHSRTLQ